MRHLQGLSVLVLGLGDSGLAMAAWCARHGAVLRVWDSRDKPPQEGALALAVLKGTEAALTPDQRLEQWYEANKPRMTRALDTLEELKRDAPFDLAKLAVANRQVRALLVS